MLRDLLYSIFFHLILFGLLFLSTTDLLFQGKKNFIKADVTPVVVSFIDEAVLTEIKNIKTEAQNEKVKDMTMEQKVSLYKKLKNNEKIETTLKQYEKSGKTIKKDTIRDSVELETENNFSYTFTPIYVSEQKLTDFEKKVLLEDQIKKEEMRKKMKEKKVLVENSTENETQNIVNVKQAVERAKKPLTVKNKKNNKKTQNENEIKKAEIDKKNIEDGEGNSSANKIDEVDELALKIFMEENIIDDELKGIKPDEIFSQEDYEKLKEINSDDGRKFSLSLRERRNIQQQIKGCYKQAILKSKKDSKSIVNVIVDVKKDGIIDLKNIIVENMLYNDTSFEIALDNVKTALVFCSPLRGMPTNKYRLWKKMAFAFDSNNLD
jgi:hypothetical protein